MSERYRITIHYGKDTFSFKTKTRVGDYAGLEDEMKNHTDWKTMAEVASQRSLEVREEDARDPLTNIPTLSREAIDYIHPAESGWATVQVGPTLKIPSFETEATGADSIREGIDQEILKKMKQAALGKAWDQAVQAVIAEDAAILDDLKRQMEAKIPQLLDQATHCPKCEADIYISPTVVSCTKCSWFRVPLQVTNLFEKKEEK